MYEGALLDANIDEGAEVHDVLDLAGHLHTLAQVLEGQDALLEHGLRVVVARVAVGLLKLGDDIVDGRVADAVLLLERRPLLAARVLARAHALEELARQGVVFRVYPGVIERVRALGDLEEAGALLEALLSHARDLLELVAIDYLAVVVAVLHYLLGQRRVDAGHVLEERMARGIDVNADAVDDRLHHLVERLGEALLVDVVLVEAHAYALGVYLDELGQGILDAPAYRNGAAYRQVELGELLAGYVARRVDRGPVLVDHRVLGLAAELREGLGDYLLHVMARRPVAYGHELYPEFLDGLGNGRPGGVRLLLLVDDEVPQVLARLVYGGALGTRADARVDAQDARPLDGRRQEQVLEVLAEDRYAVAVGPVARVRAYLAQHRRRHEPPERIVYGLGVVLVGHLVAPLEDLDRRVLVDLEPHLELALALAAVDRQHAMRLERRQGLAIVPVHLVSALLLLCLVAHALDGQEAVAQVQLLDRGAVLRVLGDALGDDVHGALDGLLGARHRQLGLLGVLLDEGGRRRADLGGRPARQDIGQGLQALLLGDHAAGLLLALIGRVDVLDLREGGALADVAVELLAQLPLGEDGLDDLDAPGLQVGKALVQVYHVSDLDLVQLARALLSVAADEGHRTALRGQLHDGGGLARADGQLRGYGVDELGLGDLEPGDECFVQFHGVPFIVSCGVRRGVPRG